MVDANHANSQKDHRNQARVVESVIEQRRTNQGSIFGLMLESHLVAGRQDCSDPASWCMGSRLRMPALAGKKPSSCLRICPWLNYGSVSLTTPHGRCGAG